MKAEDIINESEALADRIIRMFKEEKVPMNIGLFALADIITSHIADKEGLLEIVSHLWDAHHEVEND